MKSELTKEGWVLPQLEANMRNQVNISNIKVEGGAGVYNMQTSIEILRSATNVVGEIPTLIKVKNLSDWYRKKEAILKHCVKEMNDKDNKNMVVLFDDWSGFKYVGSDLKRLIKDKTVVEYPSKHNKQKGQQNIRDFIEKDNHILLTEDRFFNGCEASKVLFLIWSSHGVRNSLMRGVKNLICVDIGGYAKIDGVKKDNRFL